MKNILVTGGAGFIGSNFIGHMLNKYKDYKIINFDALTYAGNSNNLADVAGNLNYKFIKGDITDSALVNEIMYNYEIDSIINFAAETHVDNSISSPSIFVKTNVLGTQVLLDAAKKAWKIDDVGNKCKYKDKCKYIQISTDEVYGALGATGYFTEETPVNPSSPYSASKASADLLVKAYFHTFGLPINITRCSNNYGPRQHVEKLIPLMITRAMENKELPVYGDGLNVRDWIYVEDHCAAIDIVLHNGKIGEVYNIGGNNEKTNIEIVKLILRELGKNESLIRYVEDRLGHDRRYAIDARKIAGELKWHPSAEFSIAIKRTIEFYMRINDILR